MSQNRTVEFPYKEWHAIRTPGGTIASIKPIKGTWTLLNGPDIRMMARKNMNVKGLISCPYCSHTSFIPADFNPPKELGDGKPVHEYVCESCKFVCNLVLKEWDKRKLYCICYETRKGDSIEPHKEYMHAETELEARRYFWAFHGSEVTFVVGIAPVVGYFPTDKNERKLIV
jgi:hypothetical protein